MPSSNVIKTYVPEGIYHVYNRGVEKRAIFVDQEDYETFLRCLSVYLLMPSEVRALDVSRTTRYTARRTGLRNRVELLAYCLMPNHFHFLLRQHDEKAMTEFMRRLGNAYVEYFNRRHGRVGALFQGRYRAALIDPGQFPNLVRYIHRNPLPLLAELGLEELADYQYSSHADYLRRRATVWLTLTELRRFWPEGLTATQDGLTYQQFVESGPDTPDDIPARLAIDSHTA